MTLTPIIRQSEVIPTADITYKELQDARKAAGLLQHQVGRHMNVSADVISDWETGKSRPDPDQVDDLEKLYNAPGLWHGWMRYHYQSYRDRYPESPVDYSLPMAIVNIRHQVTDILRLQDDIERDAMDGRIDDRGAKTRYKAELNEIQAAITQALSKID